MKVGGEVHVSVNGRLLRAIGSPAFLGGDLEVKVIAYQVQPGPRIVVEVVWTLDGRRHVEWVEEQELT